MIRYQIAYRHENGEVEGFVGYAFSNPDKARSNAIQQVRDKVLAIGGTYYENRLIESTAGLHGKDFDTIKRDWKLG